jgi:tripartite-type tricarboxylate transporter receptor subunit TctC
LRGLAGRLCARWRLSAAPLAAPLVAPLLALLVAATLGSAQAQDFPARPIKIIAPQAAGGPNDVLGRVLADKMKDTLKQTIVVDNKPGAGGMLAAEFVAKSPADGYTLLLITASLIYGAHLMASPPIDPLKDLAPVAMVTFTPLVLATHIPSVPDVKTFNDLLAYAKANPEKLNIGVSGVAAPTTWRPR